MAQLSIQSEKEYLLVTINGELVLADSQQIKEEVKKAIEEDKRYQVIIDLSGVDFIDSSGLGVLIGWFKTVNQAQGKIAYVGLAEYVKKIISLAKLDKIFPIYSSASEAIAHLA